MQEAPPNNGHLILRLAWYINNVSEETGEKKLSTLDADTAAAVCMTAYMMELQNLGVDLETHLSGSRTPIGFKPESEDNDESDS
tara:strand:+ start:550 stop:801 length:252 start_codon:yes stop_codon:yes gene_type:complete